MGFLVPLAIAAAPAIAGAAGVGAGTIGLWSSIGGSVLGALGQMKQGKAASQAAQYNATVAANNANISRQNAINAGHEGEIAAAQAQQETRAKVGAIKADQGASGVDLNSGSSIDVRSSAAQTGQLNAITLRSNAARKAYGYQLEASGQDAQSQLDLSTAKNEKSAGLLNASTTLLSGVGNAYSIHKSAGGL